MTKKPKKRLGRPPLPAGARKATSFTFRSRGDLREKLGAAAAQSGRSISQEIERILELNYSGQDVVLRALGGASGAEVVKPLLFFFNQLDRGGIEWRGNKEIAPLMEACIGIITEAAVRGDVIPYEEWSKRINAAYRGNWLVDTGPGPRICITAKLVIQVLGLGELEPEISATRPAD